MNLILLFFCSVIPYATDLVSQNFNNKITQGFYGVFVILVILSNIWLSKVLEDENKHESDSTDMIAKRRRLLWADVAIKAIGFIICVAFYPPAMMDSVILAAMFFTIGKVKLKLN